MSPVETTGDTALYGNDGEQGLVAVELVERRGKPSETVYYLREGERTVSRREPFHAFLFLEEALAAQCPEPAERIEIAGRGRLNACLLFDSWRACEKARSWCARVSDALPSSPGAPYFCPRDPIQHELTVTGRTLFKGMRFEDLRRLQVDIECTTTRGYEFCNAEREGDRIIAIAMTDGEWTEVISGAEMDEAEMLRRFAARVRERDPDVIEGHNIFNFDLPFLERRAARLGVKLDVGREGQTPARRSSRFALGERTIAYERFEIFGRHVVDTFFLAQAYDLAQRSLSGYGLKEVAAHFGLTSRQRVYIEGSAIADMFERDPQRVMRYARHDVEETRRVSNLLSASAFAQARMLPYAYQNVCVRGNATKIDALLVREYWRRRCALPTPGAARRFAGGYTDVFLKGVVRNVHHCDVRSLYPSLMLARRIGPASDEVGAFLALLKTLRDFRLDARGKMRGSPPGNERTYYAALQGAFKILINSFYGYLGFAQGRFSDFEAAETVARNGRELMQQMIEWLRRHGARPVEIDTDGIYFVPPPFRDTDEQESWRRSFQASLPEGIDIEFDGEYSSMFSYRMKNYALLSPDGEMVIKGAALKSRGLEPFQRDFMRSAIRMRLEQRETELPELYREYREAIAGRRWPIQRLARTETLADAPATYAEKVRKGRRPRSAVYELALASDREYRAGDQVSYYVTGTGKKPAVYENARLVAEWDARHRDENVAYYLARLDALYAKFGVEEDEPAK